MRFVIDDGPWAAATESGEVVEAGLDGLSERLDVAAERGEETGFYEGLWGLPVIGDTTVSDLLFEQPSPLGIGRDVRTRLARQLDKLAGHTFDEPAAQFLDVEVNGATLLSPAAGFALAAAQDRRAVACLTPSTSGRVGAQPVSSGEVRGSVHYVTDEASHVAFFRDAIRLENADEDAFGALSNSAFPQLRFVDGVWRGLRDLSRPYRDRRDQLIDVFSVLNDSGPTIFALERHQQIEAEFMSRGVDISPENTETLADGTCRRARERPFGDQVLVFEWHVKLEAHQDRIHVHPGVEASGHRPIVGIISRHLPLPGD